MIQQSGGRPFTILTSFTVLAKDRQRAQAFAQEVGQFVRRKVGAGGAVVIPDTVRSEIAEELEVYSEDFAEEVSTSRRVG